MYALVLNTKRRKRSIDFDKLSPPHAAPKRSEVSEQILSYYYVVLIDYLWRLLKKFLLHKPKLFAYVITEFISSHMLLLHANMVVI